MSSQEVVVIDMSDDEEDAVGDSSGNSFRNEDDGGGGGNASGQRLQELKMMRRVRPAATSESAGTSSSGGVQQHLQIQASKRKTMPPLQELYSMKLPQQVVGPALKAMETASTSSSSSAAPSPSPASVPAKASQQFPLTPHTTITAVKPAASAAPQTSTSRRSVTSKPVDQLSVQMFGRRRKIMNIPKRKRLRNFRRDDAAAALYGDAGTPFKPNNAAAMIEEADMWEEVENNSDAESVGEDGGGGFGSGGANGGGSCSLSPGSKKKPGPKGPRLKETPSGKFIFKLLEEHGVYDESGNKLYQCEICSSLYIKSFSLKRHYLRTHINYVFLTEQDMLNCNIPRDNEETNNPRGEIVNGVLRGVYKCHVCFALHDSVPDLKDHLRTHAADVGANKNAAGAAAAAARRPEEAGRQVQSHPGPAPSKEVAPVITVRKFTPEAPLQAQQVPRFAVPGGGAFGPPPGMIFPPGISVFTRGGSPAGGPGPPQQPPPPPPPLTPLDIMHQSAAMMNPGVSPFFITPHHGAPPPPPPPSLRLLQAMPPEMHHQLAGFGIRPVPPGFIPSFPPAVSCVPTLMVPPRPMQAPQPPPPQPAQRQQRIPTPTSRPAGSFQVKNSTSGGTVKVNAVGTPPPPPSSSSGASQKKQMPALLSAPGGPAATFPCDDCGKVFPAQRALWRHESTVHGVTHFSCKLCGHAFGHQEDLVGHLKAVHGAVKCDADEHRMAVNRASFVRGGKRLGEADVVVVEPDIKPVAVGTSSANKSSSSSTAAAPAPANERIMIPGLDSELSLSAEVSITRVLKPSGGQSSQQEQQAAQHQPPSQQQAKSVAQTQQRQQLAQVSKASVQHLIPPQPCISISKITRGQSTVASAVHADSRTSAHLQALRSSPEIIVSPIPASNNNNNNGGGRGGQGGEKRLLAAQQSTSKLALPRASPGTAGAGSSVHQQQPPQSQPQPKKNPEFQYTCLSCGAAFSAYKEMVVHQEKVHGNAGVVPMLKNRPALPPATIAKPGGAGKPGAAASRAAPPLRPVVSSSSLSSTATITATGGGVKPSASEIVAEIRKEMKNNAARNAAVAAAAVAAATVANVSGIQITSLKRGAVGPKAVPAAAATSSSPASSAAAAAAKVTASSSSSSLKSGGTTISLSAAPRKAPTSTNASRPAAGGDGDDVVDLGIAAMFASTSVGAPSQPATTKTAEQQTKKPEPHPKSGRSSELPARRSVHQAVPPQSRGGAASSSSANPPQQTAPARPSAPTPGGRQQQQQQRQRREQQPPAPTTPAGVIRAFDRRLIDSGDAEYFARVSDNIADNLLNHMDGRVNGKRKTRKPAHFSARYPYYSAPGASSSSSFSGAGGGGGRSRDEHGRVRNRPSSAAAASSSSSAAAASFKFDPKEFQREDELENDRLNAAADPEDGFFRALGLARRPGPGGDQDGGGTKPPLPFAEAQRLAYRDRDPETWTTFAGELTKPKVFLCCVCGEQRTQLRQMLEHKARAHAPFGRWVQHLEWDGRRKIPEELMPRPPTRDGVVASTAIPTTLIPDAASRTRCTRCGWQGKTVEDLHKHIVRCAEEAARKAGKGARSRIATRNRLVSFSSRLKRFSKISRSVARDSPSSPVKLPNVRVIKSVVEPYRGAYVGAKPKTAKTSAASATGVGGRRGAHNGGASASSSRFAQQNRTNSKSPAKPPPSNSSATATAAAAVAAAAAATGDGSNGGGCLKFIIRHGKMISSVEAVKEPPTPPAGGEATDAVSDAAPSLLPSPGSSSPPLHQEVVFKKKVAAVAEADDPEAAAAAAPAVVVHDPVEVSTAVVAVPVAGIDEVEEEDEEGEETEEGSRDPPLVPKTAGARNKTQRKWTPQQRARIMRKRQMKKKKKSKAKPGAPPTTIDTVRVEDPPAESAEPAAAVVVEPEAAVASLGAASKKRKAASSGVSGGAGAGPSRKSKEPRTVVETEPSEEAPEIENFMCHGCGAVFPNKSASDRHSRKCPHVAKASPAAANDEPPLQPYACPHCAERHSSVDALVSHVPVCDKNPKNLNAAATRETAEQVASLTEEEQEEAAAAASETMDAEDVEEDPSLTEEETRSKPPSTSGGGGGVRKRRRRGNQWLRGMIPKKRKRAAAAAAVVAALKRPAVEEVETEDVSAEVTAPPDSEPEPEIASAAAATPVSKKPEVSYPPPSRKSSRISRKKQAAAAAAAATTTTTEMDDESRVVSAAAAAAKLLPENEETSCSICGQRATAPGWMARHRNVCEGPPPPPEPEQEPTVEEPPEVVLEASVPEPEQRSTRKRSMAGLADESKEELVADEKEDEDEEEEMEEVEAETAPEVVAPSSPPPPPPSPPPPVENQTPVSQPPPPLPPKSPPRRTPPKRDSPYPPGTCLVCGRGMTHPHNLSRHYRSLHSLPKAPTMDEARRIRAELGMGDTLPPVPTAKPAPSPAKKSSGGSPSSGSKKSKTATAAAAAVTATTPPQPRNETDADAVPKPARKYDYEGSGPEAAKTTLSVVRKKVLVRTDSAGEGSSDSGGHQQPPASMITATVALSIQKKMRTASSTSADAPEVLAGPVITKKWKPAEAAARTDPPQQEVSIARRDAAETGAKTKKDDAANFVCGKCFQTFKLESTYKRHCLECRVDGGGGGDDDDDDDKDAAGGTRDPPPAKKTRNSEAKEDPGKSGNDRDGKQQNDSSGSQGEDPKKRGASTGVADHEGSSEDPEVADEKKNLVIIKKRMSVTARNTPDKDPPAPELVDLEGGSPTGDPSREERGGGDDDDDDEKEEVAALEAVIDCDDDDEDDVDFIMLDDDDDGDVEDGADGRRSSPPPSSSSSSCSGGGHPTSSSSQENWSCHVCGSSFTCRGWFTQHVKRCHNADTTPEELAVLATPLDIVVDEISCCDLCGAEFSCASKFDMHRRGCTGGVGDGEDGGGGNGDDEDVDEPLDFDDDDGDGDGGSPLPETEVEEERENRDVARPGKIAIAVEAEDDEGIVSRPSKNAEGSLEADSEGGEPFGDDGDPSFEAPDVRSADEKEPAAASVSGSSDLNEPAAAVEASRSRAERETSATCTLCEKTFPRQLSLSLHMVTEHATEPCLLESSKNSQTRVLETVTKTVEPSNQDASCGQDRAGLAKAPVACQRAVKRPGAGHVQCPICNQECPATDDLLRHLGSSHADWKVDDDSDSIADGKTLRLAKTCGNQLVKLEMPLNVVANQNEETKTSDDLPKTAVNCYRAPSPLPGVTPVAPPPPGANALRPRNSAPSPKAALSLEEAKKASTTTCSSPAETRSSASKRKAAAAFDGAFTAGRRLLRPSSSSPSVVLPAKRLRGGKNNNNIKNSTCDSYKFCPDLQKNLCVKESIAMLSALKCPLVAVSVAGVVKDEVRGKIANEA